MDNKKSIKSSFPGLSDKAYELAVQEKNKRNGLGLKTSISAIVSEAVVKTYGQTQAQ